VVHAEKHFSLQLSQFSTNARGLFAAR